MVSEQQAPVAVESGPLAAATYALHFLALRASFPEWAKAEPAGGIPEALRPMPIADAHDLIVGSSSSTSFRLTIAMLAHAVRKSGDPALRDLFASAATELLQSDYFRLEDLERTTSPEAAFSQVEFAIRQLNNGGGCQIKTVPLIIDYDTKYSIATVQAECEVNRPVSDFDGAGDPQQWKVVAPQVFVESASVGTAPMDPAKGPDLQATSDPVYVLFEHARWEISPQMSSQYENLLSIRFQSAPGMGMSLRYSLFQSVNADLLLYQGPGGLSVDSGEAVIEAVTAGSTRIRASKSLRHTLPNRDPAGVILNYMSLPSLAILMNWFVVSGACP